jgi:hypothetical protein
VDVRLALATRACIVACRCTSGCKCTSDCGCPLLERSAVLGVPACRGERCGPITRVQPLKSLFSNSWKPNEDNVICPQPPHPTSSLSKSRLITTQSFFDMLQGKFKIKKRTTHSGPSQGSESHEPETGNFDRPTSYEPSKAQQGTSTTTPKPVGHKSGQQVRKAKHKFRPGDPSAGGISIGGESDDGDSHSAQAGHGDNPIGRDHLSGGPDDGPAGGVKSHNPAQKSKSKPKTKPKDRDADDRTVDDEPAVSGEEGDSEPKTVPKPGGKHVMGEKSGHGEQSTDPSQLKPKPKAKPKHKAGEGIDGSEEAGDETGGEGPSGGQTGMKKNKKVNPDGDSDLEEVDLGNEPEIIPIPKKNASASSKVPEAFEGEGEDELSRLQSRINAIRKGGHRNAVALAEDDPELEEVDMSLFEKFAITAAERQKRKNKILMVNDPDMQINIANALAETLKPKWPGYLAMGFKVAFVLGDIALIVNGITDDFILIDIPAKEIIEGAVDLYKRATESPEDKAAAIRNGRGESAAKLEKRRQEGQLALMKLAGVKNLNKQQLETYDRLRVLLAMERKAENAGDA